MPWKRDVAASRPSADVERLGGVELAGDCRPGNLARVAQRDEERLEDLVMAREIEAAPGSEPRSSSTSRAEFAEDSCLVICTVLVDKRTSSGSWRRRGRSTAERALAVASQFLPEKEKMPEEKECEQVTIAVSLRALRLSSLLVRFEAQKLSAPSIDVDDSTESVLIAIDA